MIDYKNMKKITFRLFLIVFTANFALCAHAQSLPSPTPDALRSKALDFIKSHSNIYDKVWVWEGFSYQNYMNLPNKEELNYQWFENNESEVSKDKNGNMVAMWTGLPGCKKIDNVYKAERSDADCYSLLKFSVYFDNASTPTRIKVMDIGGIE